MKIKLIIILVSAILATRSFAADWPQFRGPDRDGKSAETGLLKKWPKEGPELLWSVDGLGEGYTSAATSFTSSGFSMGCAALLHRRRTAQSCRGAECDVA